jgi:dipeptidyl aminopeptidase/acylaminoacyl peptidase
MRTVLRLLLLSVIPLIARSDPISLDDWFRGPRIQDVAISPDGRYLSIVAFDGDAAFVAVKDRTGTAPAKPVFATDPQQDVKPWNCEWVGMRRFVCRVAGHTKKNGKGGYASRLVAMDPDGGNQLELLNSAVPGESIDSLAVRAWRSDEPDTILVSGFFPGLKGYAVAKVNAVTGKQTILVKPTEPISAFQNDGHGNVLFASGAPRMMGREWQVEYFGRKSNGDKWKPLTRLAAHAEDANARLLPVIAGSDSAYAILTHGKHNALFKVDLTDQKDPEPVYWHEQRDIDMGIYGPRYELLGVTFESSVIGPQYLDPRAASIDAVLKQNFPNRWNWIESESDDQKMFVIRTSSASEASSYYVLDPGKGNAKFEAIGSEWPGLARSKLPATELVGIPMRNGNMREALFTPAAGTLDKAPLVVFADGAQLTGGFEPATYFLVTRGYSVLRPYFSGTKHDADWQYQPYLDWNGKLYDELVDAARWAAQRPGVDPDRVCIVGRNDYGGYQALLAAARADNPFKCAASLGGVSDLARPRKNADQGQKIGAFDPGGPSDEQVAKDSPVRRAADFRIPLLLVVDDTGKPDWRQGGREMAAALRAANKPHKLVLIDEVDERYLRVEYDEIARFLASSLGPAK